MQWADHTSLHNWLDEIASLSVEKWARGQQVLALNWLLYNGIIYFSVNNKRKIWKDEMLKRREDCETYLTP
jgi:hypothetical protein